MGMCSDADGKGEGDGERVEMVGDGGRSESDSGVGGVRIETEEDVMQRRKEAADAAAAAAAARAEAAAAAAAAARTWVGAGARLTMDYARYGLTSVAGAGRWWGAGKQPTSKQPDPLTMTAAHDNTQPTTTATPLPTSTPLLRVTLTLEPSHTQESAAASQAQPLSCTQPHTTDQHRGQDGVDAGTAQGAAMAGSDTACETGVSLSYDPMDDMSDLSMSDITHHPVSHTVGPCGDAQAHTGSGTVPGDTTQGHPVLHPQPQRNAPSERVRLTITVLDAQPAATVTALAAIAEIDLPLGRQSNGGSQDCGAGGGGTLSSTAGVVTEVTLGASEDVQVAVQGEGVGVSGGTASVDAAKQLSGSEAGTATAAAAAGGYTRMSSWVRGTATNTATAATAAASAAGALVAAVPWRSATTAAIGTLSSAAAAAVAAGRSTAGGTARGGVSAANANSVAITAVDATTPVAASSSIAATSTESTTITTTIPSLSTLDSLTTQPQPSTSTTTPQHQLGKPFISSKSKQDPLSAPAGAQGGAAASQAALSAVLGRLGVGDGLGGGDGFSGLCEGECDDDGFDVLEDVREVLEGTAGLVGYQRTPTKPPPQPPPTLLPPSLPAPAPAQPHGQQATQPAHAASAGSSASVRDSGHASQAPLPLLPHTTDIAAPRSPTYTPATDRPSTASVIPDSCQASVSSPQPADRTHSGLAGAGSSESMAVEFVEASVTCHRQLVDSHGETYTAYCVEVADSVGNSWKVGGTYVAHTYTHTYKQMCLHCIVGARGVGAW